MKKVNFGFRTPEGYWNKYRGERYHGPIGENRRTIPGIIIVVLLVLGLAYMLVSPPTMPKDPAPQSQHVPK